MTIEAILWDNDGVLVDTEPLFLRANREILAEIGIHVDDDQFRDINLTQGRSVLELALSHGYTADDVLAMRARRDERYGVLLDAGVDVEPWRRRAEMYLGIARAQLPALSSAR